LIENELMAPTECVAALKVGAAVSSSLAAAAEEELESKATTNSTSSCLSSRLRASP